MHLKYNYRWSLLVIPSTLGNATGAAVRVDGTGPVSSALLPLAGASGVATVTIEESDDGLTGWAACKKVDGSTDAAFVTTATDDNSVLQMEFIRTKGYLRAVQSGVTGTNVSGGVLVGTQREIVARAGDAGGSQLIHTYPQ